MTITEELTTATPLLQMRYTIEELAVIADLYDLESLPGVTAIEMSLDLRSLATRCLVARGIVVMPDNGGVEITQPHATLIAGMFDAPIVMQVTWMQGELQQAWTWFDLGDNCVRVTDDDEGIVEVAAFTVGAVEAINATLGIEVAGELPAGKEAEVVVEMTTSSLRVQPATTERSVVARVDGVWLSAGENVQ